MQEVGLTNNFLDIISNSFWALSSIFTMTLVLSIGILNLKIFYLTQGMILRLLILVFQQIKRVNMVLEFTILKWGPDNIRHLKFCRNNITGVRAPIYFQWASSYSSWWLAPFPTSVRPKSKTLYTSTSRRSLQVSFGSRGENFSNINRTVMTKKMQNKTTGLLLTTMNVLWMITTKSINQCSSSIGFSFYTQSPGYTNSCLTFSI